jgi:fermentation-respiration switch protein FrsA (DUF1100 family)
LTETRVSFTSDGIELVGTLRLPDSADGPLPALVFTGPITGVKEQVVGNYAERLTRHGFATLAFDHRNWGESGGERRQHEDPQGKISDLRDAVSFLAGRPELDADRIGIVGVCLGGGYALRAAAFDPRIKTAACVAGAYMGAHEFEAMFGGRDGFRQFLGNFVGAAQARFASGEEAYMAAVSNDDTPAAMAGKEPYEYYGTERSASPGWVNRLSVESQLQMMTFNLKEAAELISPTPLLIVHGRVDDYCTPELAQYAFDTAGEPKEIFWLDTTNHIDLYDREQYVAPAVERIADFLERRLVAAPAAAARV